jgi:hypothetical protein
LSKHCEFCGRFFVPDPRVGNRQRACFRDVCKKSRKHASQQAWLAQQEPGYFSGRYQYLKEWRQERNQVKAEVIQDKLPPVKPCLKLVLLVPGSRLSMIQDEITLRRVAGSTFAAPGVNRAMIQDEMARSP